MPATQTDTRRVAGADSLRFLINWALRREDLCGPGLCPDAPGDGGRCDHCPPDKLDAAQYSEVGLLIRRALDLRAALKLGFRISVDAIQADEFCTLPVLDEEKDRLEQVRSVGRHQ
jgi:hypothetical protein